MAAYLRILHIFSMSFVVASEPGVSSPSATGRRSVIMVGGCSRTVERGRLAALGRLGRCGLVIGSVLLLAACQEGVNVGAVNHCGYPVNVTANSVDSVREGFGWVSIDDAEWAYILTMSEGAEMIHMWVRRSEDGEILNFVVPVAELPAPPPDAVYDSRGEVEREIMLEGDRCPPQDP